VQAFAAKFKTKREVYNFLTLDCHAYEPAIQCVTVWHMRDQAMGKKGMIRADSIKHLTVPTYEALSLAKILEWGKVNCPTVIERYLPIERELLHFPRQVSRAGQSHSEVRRWGLFGFPYRCSSPDRRDYFV
jgi:hypothetical protein